MIVDKGKISIQDIKFDETIYPRLNGTWKQSTVDDYVGALKSGSVFPPLVLEKGTDRLLDGVHRWNAYKSYNKELKQQTIEDEESKQPYNEIDVEWHTVPDGVPIKLYAASLSSKHGDRLSPEERKRLARELFETNPDFSVKTLLLYIPMSKSSLHEYTKDILAKRNEEKSAIALRLSRLGWTQDEIAGVLGVTQKNVHEKLYQIPELEKSIKSLVTSNIPHEDVAKRHALPIQTIWAIDCEGREDHEKFSKLSINFQPYNVWNFSDCNDLFGNPHPGRVPGQLVMHVLAFYTNEGDVVLDPMGGSGTTPDACLIMNRKCYAYDIDSRHKRSDIISHNIMVDGWPNRIKKANLIFWDPPYYKKMDSTQIGEDGYIEGSISKLNREQYLDFFKQRLSEASKLVQKGTKLAFLMSDYEVYENQQDETQGIYVWDYIDIIRNSGWSLTKHFQVPLPTQQVRASTVVSYREKKKIASLDRYLLVAEV